MIMNVSVIVGWKKRTIKRVNVANIATICYYHNVSVVHMIRTVL
jgi:hypothetical protein